MAQKHDLKLALTPTASKQTNEKAEEPIQQTGQQDAQSEPLPAIITGTGVNRRIEFLYPTGQRRLQRRRRWILLLLCVVGVTAARR
jgi:hypothetical protein